MSILVDFLEKHNIDYVRRDIAKYEGSGSRVNVPKEWEGNVIVVREKVNMVKLLEDVRNDLAKNMESCKKMREMAQEIRSLPCSSITDEILAKTKRENDVCKRCPFGQRIAHLIPTLESLYDTKDEKARKLAQEFFESAEG